MNTHFPFLFRVSPLSASEDGAHTPVRAGIPHYRFCGWPRWCQRWFDSREVGWLLREWRGELLWAGQDSTGTGMLPRWLSVGSGNESWTPWCGRRFFSESVFSVNSLIVFLQPQCEVTLAAILKTLYTLCQPWNMECKWQRNWERSHILLFVSRKLSAPPP